MKFEIMYETNVRNLMMKIILLNITETDQFQYQQVTKMCSSEMRNVNKFDNT